MQSRWLISENHVLARYNPGGIFKVSNGIMDTPGDAKYGMTTSQLLMLSRS